MRPIEKLLSLGLFSRCASPHHALNKGNIQNTIVLATGLYQSLF